MSPVFDCTTPEGLADAIPKAAAGVRAGRLAVIPTDTLYGVGCDAFLAHAVRDLLDAKGRGPEMPPPVLIGDLAAVDGLAVEVPAWARELMARHWPGPLTLVLKAQPSLAWDLGETNGTVALRMPDDPVALALLREVGPMAVSSANRHAQPASRTIVDAATQLGAAVEFYLDGGPVRSGLASTIVDATRDEPVVLRSGPVTFEEVREVFDAHRAPSAPPDAPADDASEPLQLSDPDAAPLDDGADPAGDTPR